MTFNKMRICPKCLEKKPIGQFPGLLCDACTILEMGERNTPPVSKDSIECMAKAENLEFGKKL